MKRVVLFILLLSITVFSCSACSKKTGASTSTKIKEDFFKSGSDDSNYVELHKVKDNIWVHTTYTDYNGIRTPSNGIVAITSEGLILIDTPWNNGQTKELLELSKKVFNKEFSFAIITHAHEDRIGGIDTLLENKVDVRSTNMTMKEAEKNGYKVPQTELELLTKIKHGNMNIDVFYPGEGHTVDNIIVWFSNEKVLFGGCIIKSTTSNSIGNIGDVNVVQWPSSLKEILEKYSDAETVIPGHGEWGGVELINHTLDLLKNLH